jgi:hypothetical protein
VYGTILIASRCPGAVLYIGADVRAIGQGGIQTIQQTAGPVTLRVRTAGGGDWDTTFTVAAGSQHRIGYRPIRCR